MTDATFRALLTGGPWDGVTVRVPMGTTALALPDPARIAGDKPEAVPRSADLSHPYELTDPPLARDAVGRFRYVG